ncbi:UPF0149 family protein [Sulfitobacter sp. NFXS29]|uniref:UPF0149 family protein n=1 Tax=Sulfitobacter sp. NFXS29 TaxID=2818438 RepID=UPI0032DFB51A
MDQSDQDLDQLDALLRALPVDNMPMTLSELDGYIVGVLACPEMIPPSGGSVALASTKRNTVPH